MESDNSNPPQDRRQFLREPVRQPATVESVDFGSFETLIQNFSSSGLYVTMIEGGAVVDHTIASQLTEHCEVLVRIKIGQAPMVTCAARVDRLGKMGVGVSFYQPQDRLVASLSEVAREQGFHEQASALDTGAKGQLRDSLRDAILKFIGRHFDEFVERTQEELMDEAGKAPGTTGQTPYFEAMSILRRQGKNLKTQYLDRLGSHLADYHSEELFPELKASSGESELTLVNEKEFEDWLTLSDIIHTVELRNHREMHALEARLTVLIGSMVDSRNNPASPAAVCHHLFEVFKDQPLEHNIRLVLWKAFGQLVAQKLDQLYQQLNKILIDGGVLPKLAFRYNAPTQARQPNAPAAPVQPEPTAEPAAPDAGENVTQFPTAPGGQPMVGSVPASRGFVTGQQPAMSPSPTATGQSTVADTGTPSAATIIDLRDILLERQRAASVSHQQPGPAHTPFGMDELNQALIDLQQLAPTGENPLSNRVDDALRDRFGKGSKRMVADEHSNAIFLAQQLLDAIRTDDVVEPQAKHWIEQLEIPLLRLLLKDDSLLHDSKHPAREVIDQLGRSHVESGPESGERELAANQEIDAIVQGLRQLQEPDRQSFESAAQEINRLLKRQQRLRASQMRRVLEAAEGQHRLEKARHSVQRELDRRFGGGKIPLIIQNLLEQGLRSLLDLAAVRGGVESDEWRDSIEVVDELREGLSDSHQSTPEDLEKSEKLIGRIDEKLIQAGADGPQREIVLAELHDVLPGLRGDDSTIKPESVDYETTETEPDESPDDDPDKSLWRGRAKLLQTGSWLLLPDANGEMQARRLVWVSEDRDRFVFVDRQGRKSLEMTLDELAAQLGSEQADVVEDSDKSLMDRSWQGMIEQMHEQIAHQATHDQLTGALNRKEFERQLRLKLGESKLMHSQHVVLQFNLDQFKVINSTAGHDAGDQLLKDLAGLFDSKTPEDSAVARLGGDEFAIMLPCHEPAPGHEAAEKLRKAISDHRTKWKRRKLKTSASIGLVSVNCDTKSVSQVLNQMESACAAAKDAGADRVKSYQLDDQEMTQRDRAMHWVEVVERAVETDSLALHAQRIQPLEGEPDKEHFEVLVRMHDEDGELVSPAEFVPAAEAYGRIHFLDEWVFKKTFNMLANSPRQEQIARLSVNVSGKTFSRPRFADSVQEMLEESGVSPSKICFEITETAAISNLSRCTDFLRQLSRLGCRFSLDDFGTGLSSFSYLKHLPVDYLKIDGSFVKEVVHSKADYGLVKTINEIGHFLGKQTVAEYVEDDEIKAKLKEIGVDFAQGFGIAHPIPLEQILGYE